MAVNVLTSTAFLNALTPTQVKYFVQFLIPCATNVNIVYQTVRVFHVS